MPAPRGIQISIRVSTELKSALEVEAWEENRTLSQYVAGLLERRGKWARSVGRAGGYDIQAELPPSKRGANEA